MRINGLGLAAAASLLLCSATALAVPTLTNTQTRSGGQWPPAVAENEGDPTTAEIKAEEGNRYLRLQQERSDVTTRVLFVCVDRQMAILAGIVTDPEISSRQMRLLRRAYIEMDGREALAQAGPQSAEAQDSTIWVQRDIGPETERELLAASRLDIWLELGDGGVRWGGPMNLRGVHTQMAAYFEQCHAV
jgi:hypothetical protein